MKKRRFTKTTYRTKVSECPDAPDKEYVTEREDKK